MARSPSSKRRPDQVAEVIRQIVAEALLTEVRDPRIQQVTITGIEVSPDLSYARILVTVHGDDTERDLALEGLGRASGFFRSRVAKALSTRITPQLTFVADRGQEHAAKIEAILGAIKRGGRALTGGLLIDKPAGMTSHDVVAAVRRRFKTRAVGHTGTLDPFATGLLVVVLGGATRLARFVEAERKTYLATARLGLATTTDDLTGEPAGETWTGTWPDRTAVEDALSRFIGRIEQRPPAFSAKRVDGVRSYALAREGRAVELNVATVLVEQVSVTEYDPPVVSWRATVGPGTYLRAMARDLGASLGTGGHLVSLRRESVGPFAVADAHPLAALTGTEALIPPLGLLGSMAQVGVSAEEAGSVRQGRRVGRSEGLTEAALVHDGRLVAVATAAEGAWQPVVVLAA